MAPTSRPAPAGFFAPDGNQTPAGYSTITAALDLGVLAKEERRVATHHRAADECAKGASAGGPGAGRTGHRHRARLRRHEGREPRAGRVDPGQDLPAHSRP